MNAWNRNRVTEKLGINYPIVQGPLGGLSSQKLTVAVSNFGGLGSFEIYASIGRLKPGDTDYSLMNKKDGKTFTAGIYVSSKMTRSRTRVTTIRSSNGKPCADVPNSRQVNGAVRLN